MATPTPKIILEARERARQKASNQINSMMANNTTEQLAQRAVTVTETPRNVANFLARAQALPEEITNAVDFISTPDLAQFDVFYITSAVLTEGKDFNVPGQKRQIVRMTVMLETETGWSEWVWTPPAFSDRIQVAQYFLKNPNAVLGPVKLEDKLTGNGQVYNRLVNTTLPPF